MGKNKVKFGLSNCHIAPFTINENGQYVYETPFSVPGAVNLSFSPSGETNDFYADNVIYFSSTANQGYEGDLELALITDEIRTKVLGETVDANGAYIESAEDKAKGFAFGFQIDGDQNNRKYWYYNCSLTRPNTESATTETTITPNTDSLSMKAMPRISDKKVRTFLDPSETNTEAYEGFFNAVYEMVEEGTSTEETNPESV